MRPLGGGIPEKYKTESCRELQRGSDEHVIVFGNRQQATGNRQQATGNRQQATGSDAKHRMTQWLAKLLIVLSIAVSCEALAAVESVPPEQKWAVSSGVGALLNISFYQPSKPEACLFFFNNFVINSPYPPHSYIGDDGTNCNWTNKFGGQISNYLLATACPVPKVNPDVPYTYLPATNTCERELIYKLKLTPDSATIEPGQSYEFTATVTTLDDKQPSISVSVSVKVEAGASNGGAPPQGEVSPAIGSNTFPIKFTSTQGSGIHTITATCGLCENGPQTVKVIVKAGCPEHASGSPCACDEGYKFNKDKTQCVCPIDPLPDLPADDLCAQSLNKGLGVDVDDKCPKLDDRMLGANGQLQCFANKITAANAMARPQIPYSGPTAKYRNAAYQAHLLNIWKKMIELIKLEDPAEITACAPLRNKVAAEKGCDTDDGCPAACTAGSHCIRNKPATYSNHTQGTAFDVPQNTINGLINELTPLPPAPMSPLKKLQAQRFWIASWLAKPTACNLEWGGNFNDPKPDFVHFQLP
ncbi:MAG: M15 family metallopeptidase [Sideroxydans sp.]|nr:M15 family metallopeptidase [Sideroxydans sp.]